MGFNKKDLKTFRIISLGCSKNLVDSEYIRGMLIKGGMRESVKEDQADCVIVNTCGFILPAKTEAIETTLEAAELKKSGKVKCLIMTGCFSERYAQELPESMPEVDAFFGVNALDDMAGFLFGHSAEDVKRELMTPAHYGYLKIAEGCDNTCTYCAIPLIRGPQKSLTPEEIRNEALYMANKGVKECLVIAQDTTAYGDDLDSDTDLADILTLLDDLDVFEWIRVHYMHPNRMTDKLIEVFKTSKSLIPYIDVPVQHSHDVMLRRMGRGGSEKKIRELIKKIRRELPDCCIRTTVMTGFPGETPEMFGNLEKFVKDLRFDRLGAFAFSMEEDTPAEKLKDDVPEDVKETRRETVMDLQQEISLEKNQDLLGTRQRVLIDSTDEYGDSYGRTFRDSPEVDNTVIVPGGNCIPGEFYEVVITDALEYEVIGELVQ